MPPKHHILTTEKATSTTNQNPSTKLTSSKLTGKEEQSNDSKKNEHLLNVSQKEGRNKEIFFKEPDERKPENRTKFTKASDVVLEVRKSLAEGRLRLQRPDIFSVEDEELEKLIEDELKAQKKKESVWVQRIKAFAAKADVFAAAHTMPKHQVCISVAAVMIPMSILTISWDLLAAIVFQIPHLSTIDAPGFILFINFIAMPVAMYGYMMEYLMYEHSRLAVMGLICVIVHPILFFIRAFMEYHFNGYRNESKLYFESKTTGEPVEYTVGFFDAHRKTTILRKD